MIKRQIATVPPGKIFRTLATLRDGVVLEMEQPRDDCGVLVQFSDGSEKVLHPEIRVQV